MPVILQRKNQDGGTLTGWLAPFAAAATSGGTEIPVVRVHCGVVDGKSDSCQGLAQKREGASCKTRALDGKETHT